MAETSSAAPETPPRVGYILKMFPRLSETFILNELLALQERGVDLSIFSLMHPNDGRFHGRLGDLHATAEYFPREKPETTWKMIRNAPDDGLTPEFARWEEAADFLGRWGIPKDLDLLLRAVQIARRVREAGIEHLHAHFATIATQMAALVNILTGVPFSFTSHAKDIFRETVNRELYADLLDRAAFNITVSDYNRRYLLEHTPGIAPEKVVRLYNGIDLEYFPAVPRRTSPGEVPHFLSVGRLVAKKGFPQLLESVRLRKNEGLPFRLTIVGDGDDRDLVAARVRELDLEDEVTLAGALPQERVRDLCAEADLMVLACVADSIGNQDALPTTLLEALACDIPIVSTRIAGIPEIVGDEAGVVVEPDDVPALASALESVWRRVREGGFLPGTGRRRAEELFDLRRNAAELDRRFRASAGAGAPR